MRAAPDEAIFPAMHTTYELYADGEEDHFQPVTCRTHEELMSAVARLMAERPARAVEVRHFGAHMFTVTD